MVAEVRDIDYTREKKHGKGARYYNFSESQ